ncbi:PGC-1 and ERR-induced regulator in muscle protein 1 isoform X2 [Dendropsophus ebraccatus]|uniref:PGC-1 and ERR-induced regulator in muscle protein 1 isoform X2 n=1 Tax=Dendropsophus ebraccatus TaxID=150705 RepID=UPI003831E88F
MDNFEYSIQINDRDWEEFYSTAEECGLMQASLANEEELLLSDTEREDTLNRMPSNKHKLIRVSLCPPPPPPEESPVLPISQTDCGQTNNRRLGLSEDILSGSEGEEEFGSVTRFLCQKEYLMQKKEPEQKIDIPLPKPFCGDKITKTPNEHSMINSVEEGLVEYMRTDTQQNMGKTTMESSNTQDDATGAMLPIQPEGNARSSINVSYPNNSSHCAHRIESCSSANGYLHDENILGVNTSGKEAVDKMGHSGHEATTSGSLTKDDCLEMFGGPASLEEPSSSKNSGLVYHTMENGNSCEVAEEANVNSSAVEQNVPTSTIEESNSCMSDNLNIDVKATPNMLDSVDYSVPGNITARALGNPIPLTHPSSASHRKTILTLPEMYDLFFDDVSDTLSLETEPNMETKEGIVYTPEMYEYFFNEDEEEDRAKSEGGNTRQESSTDLALASTSSPVATWPEACEFFFADGPQDQDREGFMFSVPSSQVQSAADIIQPFIPKGFSVRRAHHRRGLGGSLNLQEHSGTPEESSFSASALLANLGAVSAIQYLRRRRRRPGQDSPPQTEDET